MQEKVLVLLVPCAVAACACASFMGVYFGAAWSGMASFLCCLLLFLCAALLRPAKREAVFCAVLGGVFGVMYTLGYSYDTMDSYVLVLKNPGTMVRGALCMVSLGAVAFCVCLLLARLLDALRHACARQGEADAAERRQLFLMSAALIALGSLPYLLLYWPGLNIYDTHDQLLQFFGYPSYIGDGSALSDHHPVFLTVLYAAFMKLGLLLGNANIGQAVYSLVSILALALTWAYALCALYDAGLGRRACMVIAGFAALYPVLALYAFNMCKDVSAAPFVLLYVCQMIRLERTDGEAIRSGRFAAQLFLTSLLLMLTRKPSLYALSFAALFLILRYRGVRVRLAAVTLGAAALFHVGYSGLLLPALHVIPGETREMLSIPFQMTARCLLTEPDAATQAELDAVSRVLDLESIQNYDPRLSDAVKDASNPDATLKDMAAYARAWFTMGLRHPGVYLDAWLNMIYGYFYPSASNTIVCLTLNSPDQGGMNLTQDTRLDGLRLKLHDFIYYTLRRLPGAGALFFVSTVTWAFLFLFGYAALRGGARAAAPWMFFVGVLGICMLSPKSGEIRYMMPVLYALPMMLGAMLLPERSAKA